MVAAIRSSSSAPTTPAPTGLKGELAKARKEYSACINCASANTDAGRRNIQQLDVKIQQIQARIDASAAPASPATAAAASLPDPGVAAGRIDVYA